MSRSPRSSTSTAWVMMMMMMMVMSLLTLVVGSEISLSAWTGAQCGSAACWCSEVRTKWRAVGRGEGVGE